MGACPLCAHDTEAQAAGLLGRNDVVVSALSDVLATARCVRRSKGYRVHNFVFIVANFVFLIKV